MCIYIYIYTYVYTAGSRETVSGRPPRLQPQLLEPRGVQQVPGHHKRHIHKREEITTHVIRIL